MGLGMRIGHAQSFSTEMRPSPELVRVAQVLALSAGELAEMIDDELAENPALEVDPRRDDLVGWQLPGTGASDPAARFAYRATPLEELWREVAVHVPNRDHALARYVVDSLDQRGLLEESPAVLSTRVGVPVERVVEVVELIQEVAPPGVGAADLEESLRFQVRAAVAEGSAPPLASALVERHLAALCDDDLESIARDEGVTSAEVSDALTFIRRRLCPAPSLESIVPAWDRAAVESVTPSVSFSRTRGGDLRVEVLEALRHPLSLSTSYDLPAVRTGREASPEERRARSHVELHRRRAADFLAQMRQRWRTLQSIGECLARRQEQYLLRGPRFLSRLTRAEVADEIGVHESTVSRATANKYVLMPDDSVAPFQSFFTTSAPVLEALKELVREEGRVRSDSELARELSSRGHPIARRTVAKYRTLLGIPSSSIRKSPPLRV